MKVVSFFSEKGGAGKSLHTILFSSWLQYHEGMRVCVLDFEPVAFRIGDERDADEARLRNPLSPLSRYCRKLEEARGGSWDYYPVIWFGGTRILSSSDKVLEMKSDVERFIKENADKYDCLVMDFPSDFTTYSIAFEVLCSGFCDLVVIPVSIARASRACAFSTAINLAANKQKVRLFWNDVSVMDIARKGFLDAGEKVFNDEGLEFLPVRIKSFGKADREADKILFVKSTVVWPQRYVEMACPQLVDLYGEVKGLLEL